MLRLKGSRGRADVREIEEDARRLALELAGLTSSQAVDVMRLGIILEPGERAWREVGVELRHRMSGSWSAGTSCVALVTDRRVLLKTIDGHIVSLWWGSLVGFEPCLAKGYVVLDYGDGTPRLLSGPHVSALAVVGVMAIYGAEGLVAHPALERLRTPS